MRKSTKIFVVLAAVFMVASFFTSCDDLRDEDNEENNSFVLPESVGVDPFAGKTFQDGSFDEVVSSNSDEVTKYEFKTDKTLVVTIYEAQMDYETYEWGYVEGSSETYDYSYNTEKKELYTRLKSYKYNETDYTSSQRNALAKLMAEDTTASIIEDEDSAFTENSEAPYKEYCELFKLKELNDSFKVRTIKYSGTDPDYIFETQADFCIGAVDSQYTLSDGCLNYQISSTRYYEAFNVTINKTAKTFIADNVYYLATAQAGRDEPIYYSCHKVEGSFEGTYAITNEEEGIATFTFTKKPAEVTN